jgi:outer membrane protein OmpA-like peptidoglycan-associated protein
LKDLAKLLAEIPTLKLELSGHTDNAGNPKANLDLSKRRTLSVQNFLLKSGAKKEQVTSLWFGDKKPIASNKTPQGRTKNRRVEMKLQYE